MRGTLLAGRRPFFRPVLRMSVICLVCGAFVAMACTAAHAQSFGTISGNITDPSGAGVPGAKVTASETGTGFTRTVTADSTGHYVIPNLRPTQYDLTVQAQGFRKSIRSHVTLLANQAATVDTRLQLGSSVQSVTVAGNASLVNTTTSTLNDVVGQARMVELPLNGRDAAQLINLVAGAKNATPVTVTGQGALPGAVHPSINGSRDNQTSYNLDGANFLDQYYNTNIPFPFPDSLQEFSVQTHDYSTRYGENSGGAVNVVTKSGSNQLHGDAFEFVRNSVFNSRNFFAKAVDPLQRNQFGGTVGGPIVIPHIYNGRNRTFFFFGYQGERYRDIGTAAHAVVPTTAELSGDFSASGATVNDPLTGKPFPGNQIPTKRFDPASLGLEKYLPQVGGNGSVFYNRPTNQNINQYILRIDHKLGDKDSLTGRYFRDHVFLQPQNPTGDILGYSLGYDQPVQNLMIQETHTFRPNLLNQASFQYNTVPTAKIAPPNSPNAATFGVTGLWLPSQPWIQNISVSGFFAVNGGAVGPFNASDIGGQDNLSWVKGRHNLDFGFSVDRAAVNLGDQYLSQGSFGFTSDITNDAVASFLLGKLRTFNQGFGEFKNNRDTFWSFYANDSFHATRRLTLNYGLRYEPYMPWDEIKGRVEQFRINNFYSGVQSRVFTNAPAGLLFPGDPGMPFDGVTANYTDLAPRVGFAYDVTGDGKTSIRGGAGMYYDSRTAGVINNRFADITPFSPQVSVTDPQGPFSNPILGFSGYPFPASYPPPSDAAFPAPVQVITYDPSTKYLVPVTYEWDLVAERQLARNWMLQVAYVGSQSNHNKETIQLNPAQYIPGSKLGTDQRRLFLGYTGIAMDGQDTNSNFHALEVTLKKQMMKRLSLTAAYTYSKAIDDVPNGGNNNDINSDSSSALPWYAPGRHQFDYGPSGFDNTHRLVVSYVWMLPALSGANGFARGVLGGWEFNGIVTGQSGGPFTITAGKDQSNTGLGQDRAVEVAGVQPFASNQFASCAKNPPCVNYLNPAAFAQPAVGTFGMLGKDSFYGPDLFTWDMGLFKNFALTERLNLQFRAEFFNVFNRANFNNPASSETSGTFGDITGAGDPRIGQLALKLVF
ncbi:MAG: carboxypeptidase regulatory-like domain-containing protein [Terriglobia bacterium]